MPETEVQLTVAQALEAHDSEHEDCSWCEVARALRALRRIAPELLIPEAREDREDQDA